jgi:nicotinamide mononucleotide transporter
MFLNWILSNWIEIFGAAAGIVYVFLEIKQNLWLWPVGITTSAVYIWVFFTGKLYADMSLQVYYLIVSCAGWYWWVKGTGQRAQGSGHSSQGTGTSEYGPGDKGKGQSETPRSVTDGLQVTRLKLKTGVILALVFLLVCAGIWFFLIGLTDSPVPEWDSFITSLSIVATWMLARKIYEHWFLWLVVNSVSMVLFIIKGLYPTVILYFIYFIMSFAGLKEWKRSL